MGVVKIIAKVIYPYGGVFGYIEQNTRTKKYWYCPKSPMQIIFPSFSYNFVERNLIREGYIVEPINKEEK